MNFRSLPFQFTPSDPAARQLELQKRFGLPASSKGNKMFVDLENSSSMTTMGGNYKVGSPRLQHRIPMFMEGSDYPVKQHSVLHSNNVDAARKPRERIVPIQVEGVNCPTRHRTFSGPAGYTATHGHNIDLTPPLTKRFMQDYVPTITETFKNKPHVYNIPVKIEGKDKVSESPNIVEQNLENRNKPLKKPDASENSPSVVLEENCKVHKDKAKSLNSEFNVSMQKIEKVLQDLNLYRTEVQDFSGIIKDKQYRYLDEMLTRCMINLDDVDTMGNEQIRSSRKAAIKEVQLLIDMLESKLITVCSGSTQVEQSVSEPEKSVNEVEMTIQNNASVLENDMRQVSNATEPCKSGLLSNKETVGVAEVIVNNTTSKSLPVEMKNMPMNDLKDNELLENVNTESKTSNSVDTTDLKQTDTVCELSAEQKLNYSNTEDIDLNINIENNSK